jgi:hypothetical protein
MLDDLKDILGETVFRQEPIQIHSDLIETELEGEGSVEYDDGKIINLSDLPPGTEEIRIYATA